MKRLCLILLLIFASLGFAFTCALGAPNEPYIERFNVEAYIEKDDSCSISISFTLVVPETYDRPVTSLKLPLLERQDIPPRKGDITSWETSSGVNLDWIESTYLSHIMIISFEEPIYPGERREVRIFLSATGGVFVVSIPGYSEGRCFYYRFYKPNASLILKDSMLKVYLPPNSTLRQFKRWHISLFTPTEGLLQIGEITSGRVFVSWDLTTTNVVSAERVAFTCTYSLEQQSIAQPETNTSHSGPPPSKTSLSLTLVSSAASASLAFLVSWLLFGRKVSIERPLIVPEVDLTKKTLDERDLKKIEGIVSQLSSEEVEILRLLARNGGSMKQWEIPLNIGFSKSKISRILKRMENMGLITRNLVGRTKQVNLSPAFLAYFLSRAKKLQEENQNEELLT